MIEDYADDARGRHRAPPGGAAPAALVPRPPCPSSAAAPSPPRAPPPTGYVRPRHVAWAELLRRTFGLDVLACPDCGGRLRLLATIAEPCVITRILAHLGLPLEPPAPLPPRRRPRAPVARLGPRPPRAAPRVGA